MNTSFISRRKLGQQILGTAAALGLQSVGAQTLAGRSPSSVRVLIIGSGYGGAVTALRLAKAGIAVTIVEMGRLWDTPGWDGKLYTNLLQPDGRSMWLRTKTKAVVSGFLGFPTAMPIERKTGILDAVEFPGIDVYCGRGVGGGSLVNQGMTVTPLREVLSSVMPAGVDLDALYSTYFPRALTMLGSNGIRPGYFESSPYYRYARVARSMAAKAGYVSTLLPSTYSYDYMEREEAGLVPKSALNAEAAYGNNYGKGSLDKNYLAEAVATGLVTIHALHKVTKISTDTSGRYVVNIDQIDTSGNLVAKKTFDSEYLFVSAGSIGTSQLLVRAKETGTLPLLNAAVGTRWSANGDIFTARLNGITDAVGTKQSTITTGAFWGRDAQNKPLLTMSLCLPVPILETFTNLSVTMTSNPDTAAFSYNASTDAVTLNWNGQNAASSVASAKFVHDRINRAARGIYRTDLFGGKAFADTSTYHPVGGVPLGQATDLFGRLKGYKKLYAVDGSLMPGSLAANPLLTVTAMAERIIDRVLAEDFAISASTGAGVGLRR